MYLKTFCVQWKIPRNIRKINEEDPKQPLWNTAWIFQLVTDRWIGLSPSLLSPSIQYGSLAYFAFEENHYQQTAHPVTEHFTHPWSNVTKSWKSFRKISACENLRAEFSQKVIVVTPIVLYNFWSQFGKKKLGFESEPVPRDTKKT